MEHGNKMCIYTWPMRCVTMLIFRFNSLWPPVCSQSSVEVVVTFGDMSSEPTAPEH